MSGVCVCVCVYAVCVCVCVCCVCVSIHVCACHSAESTSYSLALFLSSNGVDNRPSENAVLFRLICSMSRVNEYGLSIQYYINEIKISYTSREVTNYDIQFRDKVADHG